MKNIIILPNEVPRTTSECLENLAILLETLNIDVADYADKILRGEPKAIYSVINVISQIYKKRILEIERLRGEN